MTQKITWIEYQLKKPARALYLSAIEPTSGDPSWPAKYQATLGLHDDDAASLFDLQNEALKQVTAIPEGDEKLAVISGDAYAERTLTRARQDAKSKPDKAETIMASAEKRAELFKSFKAILICDSAVAAQDKFNGRYDKLHTDPIRLQKMQAMVDRQQFVVEVLDRTQNPPVIQLNTQEKLDAHADKFYWGCMLGAVITFEPYRANRSMKRDTDGVKAYPRKLIWVAHGEKLGAAAVPTDYSVYDDYAGEGLNTSPDVF